MKRTIDEVKYLMAFYHINRMPIFSNNTFVGYITKDLVYDKANAFSVYSKKEYAIEAACEQIDSFIEAVKNLRSKELLKVSVIEVVYEKERSIDIDGTLDEIFETVEKMNNRLRYCNGHYFKLKSHDLDKIFRIWRLIISESRSFNLFYGDGIVD